ncbi:hypothetical protein HOC80_04640 [archaeon]|jgi:hypothetical protein|nr:hypothetical protein [archaeon]MBT4417361.1 hypothetical protein [archaeon]
MVEDKLWEVGYERLDGGQHEETETFYTVAGSKPEAIGKFYGSDEFQMGLWRSGETPVDGIIPEHGRIFAIELNSGRLIASDRERFNLKVSIEDKT